MCTSSEVLPTPEDALPHIPIDQFTASALGLIEIVETYLTSGDNVNLVNIEGWTMLQYASFIGHCNLAKYLLDNGADPNLGTPLLAAARCGNESIIVSLIGKGALVERVDQNGLTAIHHAIGSGQDGSVTVLLRHCKKLSISESNVLLHSAVTHGNIAVLKALLDVDLSPSVETRMTMIEIAQGRGDGELLHLVVNCGNIPQPRIGNSDPFNRYLQRGPLEMQKLLQSRVPTRRPTDLHLSPAISPVGVTPGLTVGLNTVSPPTPIMNPKIYNLPNFNSVADVLKYLNLEKYLPLFEREDIDLQTFLTLTDADLKAIPIDLLGPRKKMLNYMRAAQSGGSPDHTSQLKLALLTEQQNVAALQDKIKQDRANELKNQQIIQSLFLSYQNIRDSKDKILTSLTNASYVIQHIEEELGTCRDLGDRLPGRCNYSNSDSGSLFASSWPASSLGQFGTSLSNKESSKHTRNPSEDSMGEHIALSSVNSVLESSPYKEEGKHWSSPCKDDGKQWSWDDVHSGSSTSTLNASCSVDKLRKHLESAVIYTSTLVQHVQDSKLAANNISTYPGGIN